MTPARRECEWAISVDAQTSRLAEIRRFVEQVTAEAALDLERAFDLKLAVSEACANAVEHAGCESSALEVSAKLCSRRLTFVITDRGLFRPPSSSKRATSNRGLGLLLIVTLMDEVNFVRLADGGTEVSLSVLLDSVRTGGTA